MNFAFVIVLVSATSGLASLFALRPIAPHAGPIIALAIMAVALLTAARRQKRAETELEEAPAARSIRPAGESLNPA